MNVDSKEYHDDEILFRQDCLDIAQESGDKVAEMKAYMMLGEALLKKEEYDDAVFYSKKCLAIAQESGDKLAEMAVHVYIMLGKALLKKEEYDEAILYCKECLAIAQESGDKVAEMLAYIMLGNAHLQKEEYDEALFYSKRCLAIAQESGHKVAEMNAYIMLGNAYLQKEKYDTAILCSRKYLAIAQESDDKVAEMNAYKMLGEAYSKTWPCCHYKRICTIKFPCCGRFYPCQHCHNNSDQCKENDKKAVHGTHLYCLVCCTEQVITEDSHHCINCNTKFAEYSCGICKRFMGDEKMPFHCEPCGVCRNFRDRLFHCDVCNVCLQEHLRSNHGCRPNSGHDDCCICLEDVFRGCHVFQCSHKAHRNCYRSMLQNRVRKCPMCRHPLNKPLQRNSDSR